jgi:hypothetical protein
MGRGNTLWNVRLILVRKLLAVVLCGSFVFTPLAAAFAQDAGTDTAPVDSGASSIPIDPPAPSPDFSIPGIENPPPSPPAEAVDTGSTVSPPADSAAPSTSETPLAADQSSVDTSNQNSQMTTLSAGSFGGDGQPTVLSQSIFSLANATPKADGQTGALTQNLKLDIPPGRNGLQPDLALQYNSQRAEDGIVGYGWTINIPYIQRLNKVGSQSLYNLSVLHLVD